MESSDFFFPSQECIQRNWLALTIDTQAESRIIFLPTFLSYVESLNASWAPSRMMIHWKIASTLQSYQSNGAHIKRKNKLNKLYVYYENACYNEYVNNMSTFILYVMASKEKKTTNILPKAFASWMDSIGDGPEQCGMN